MTWNHRALRLFLTTIALAGTSIVLAADNVAADNQALGAVFDFTAVICLVIAACALRRLT